MRGVDLLPIESAVDNLAVAHHPRELRYLLVSVGIEVALFVALFICYR